MNDIIDPNMDQKQPVRSSRGRKKGQPAYFYGAKRSVAVLKELKFDPITELVDKYRKLEKEITIHEGMRDGTMVFLTDTGKVRRYDPEIHMSVYNMLISVSEKLLRYGYGRVPELAAPPKPVLPPMLVKLTKDNAEFQISSGGTPDYDEEGTFEDFVDD